MAGIVGIRNPYSILMLVRVRLTASITSVADLDKSFSGGHLDDWGHV
jgi:hypothetical protein